MAADDVSGRTGRRDSRRRATACALAVLHALAVAFVALLIAGFAGEIPDRAQRFAVQAGLIAIAVLLVIGVPVLSWRVLRHHERARVALIVVEVVLAVACIGLAPISVVVVVLLSGGSGDEAQSPYRWAWHPRR